MDNNKKPSEPSAAERQVYRRKESPARRYKNT